jgi:predicted RNA-binding protein with PUA-like domain
MNPPAVLLPRWLVKSEPDVFSWDDQVRAGIEPWTGVRNHAAKNHLKAMRRGDRAFFYHSNIGREIVGIVEVVREAYPDPTAEGGDWVAVDVKAVMPLPRPVPLAAIKAEPRLADLALVRQARLSVMPIAPHHAEILLRMGGLAPLAAGMEGN